MSNDSSLGSSALAQATQRKTRQKTQTSEASVSTRPQRVAAAEANRRLPNAIRPNNKRAGSPSVQPETAKQKRMTPAGSDCASKVSSGTDSTQGLGTAKISTAKAGVNAASQKVSRGTLASRGRGRGRGRGGRGSQGRKNEQSSARDETHNEMTEPVNTRTRKQSNAKKDIKKTQSGTNNKGIDVANPRKPKLVRKLNQKIVDSEDDETEDEDQELEERTSEEEDEDEEKSDVAEEEDDVDEVSLQDEVVFIPGGDDTTDEDEAFSPVHRNNYGEDADAEDRSENGDADAMALDDSDIDITNSPIASSIVRGSTEHKVVKSIKRRDQIFAEEVPQIIPAARNGPASSRTNWPEYAQLNSYTRGKDLPLKKQHALIVSVIQGAISKLQVQCVLEHAFPELLDKISTAWTVLLESAVIIVRKDVRMKDISERISCDLEFVTPLSNLIIDRISTFRKSLKDQAEKEIAAYELGTEEKCAARVEGILELDKFVFPGTWDESKWNTVTHQGTQTFVHQSNQPYCHIAIKKTLKRFFFHTPKHLGSQLTSTFTCTYQDPTGVDRRNEMPVTMVALVATAIFACLAEWTNGTYAPISFSGDRYSSVYDAHVEALNDLIRVHPKNMHNILAGLLEYCRSQSVVQKGKGALSLVDFGS